MIVQKINKTWNAHGTSHDAVLELGTHVFQQRWQEMNSMETHMEIHFF